MNDKDRTIKQMSEVEKMQKRITELETPKDGHKQAEESLEDSEEKFRQFFENEPGYCYMISPEGVILNVNRTALKKLGYEKEELVGKPLKVIYAHESREVVKQIFEKWKKTGKLRNEEITIITRSGDRRTVLLSANAVKDKDGKILYSISVQKDITGQKKAEKALLESEERYRELAESIGDVFFAFDKNLKYTYWNKASEELTWISKNDAIGKHILEVFPDNKETRGALKIYQKVLKTNQPGNFITEYHLRDKNYFFDINVYPSGTGLSVFVKDITKHKQADEKIKEKTRQLKERVKELKTLYGISDLVRKNRFSLEEILKGAVEVIPPGWQYPEITGVRIILEGKEYGTKNFRETAWKQTGDIVIHGKISGILEVCYLKEMPEEYEGPFLKEERDLINAVAERLGRIIERLRAEEKLEKYQRHLEELVEERTYELERLTEHLRQEVIERKRAEEEVRESESKLKSILSSMVDLVFGFDKNGRFVFYHSPRESLLYVPPEKFLGKTMPEVLPPGICEKFDDLFEKNKNGKSGEFEYSLEIGGKIMWFSAKISPIFFDGKFTGSVAVARDITEHKAAEDALKNAMQELKELDMMKDEFFTSAAHELQNPLTPVKAQSQLLLGDYFGKLNEEQKKSVEMILASTNRIIKLTRDIMTVSRMRAGMLKFEMSENNICDIIESSIKDLEISAGEKQIEIMKKYPGKLPVNCDRDRITQVMENLIENAIKFTPRGGKIIVEAKKIKNDIIVSVADTGIGISKENREKIFNTFFQISSKYGGTGLGLSICKTIIENHKGNIKVESELLKGSKFTFTLPGIE
ncbi:hypothetical protein BEH94_09825 [Candidatus Altiarchaeales archaeon WOR_SM1_SCG]|nr:hypothetical protein BEH94_09825 [Candidatus Altiarchaeales archaeon WOR_SM1_SCG]